MNPPITDSEAAAKEPPVDDRPFADDAEHDDAEHRGAGKRRWWSAPFRWVRNAASTVLRPLRALASTVLGPLRALISSPVRLAKTIFMATVGKDRGFGFWWLVATIAVALIIGLVLAVVLSPVIGILAAIIVGIWMLVSRSGSSGSDEDDSQSASEPPIRADEAH